MTTVVVELEPFEVALAEYVGRGRAEVVRQRKLVDVYPVLPGHPVGAERDRLGALAELAVAKWAGRYWPGAFGQPTGSFTRVADVPPDIEVPWTRYRNLLIRDRDNDSRRYVLVTGDGPAFTIHGWLYPADARRAEYRGKDDRTWLVPSSALCDPEGLLRDPAGVGR